ncbi:helix-turn-helix domain-containing protein [Microbulbifer sp. OS29]|uniref:Helix-turn-helix domain-containing protein n=1 Tax=Microbulbifer okhotskensis TaxID=2926617 RepID=A0A9X2J6X8_9GAMM|nr:helix-turn-helix domain-containing protein [Microbulbifer okhotskensis]MCO1335909.1 helix-turn-helix domain-containing protein [Microbulbifer okhotskensis]
MTELVQESYPPQKVAILAHRQVSLFELGCATELFCLPRPELSELYSGEIVTFAEENALATGGLALACRQVESLMEYDLLVIPCWSTATQPQDAYLERVSRELAEFAAAGRQILTFCSGAFLPAELGLFDGRQATTHWLYADHFRERFPKVEYVGDVLYVWEGSLACSAGSTAAIDLGIEFLRRNHGYELANSVARRLVMAPHRRGSQAQYVEMPVAKRPDHFSAALDWAIVNLDGAIKIDDLAQRAHLSRRSFDRKFRQSMGIAPKEWLIQQRLRAVQKALESGKESVDRAAQMAGFESSATLRHHFRRAFGISPSEYQRQFQVSTTAAVEA